MLHFFVFTVLVVKSQLRGRHVAFPLLNAGGQHVCYIAELLLDLLTYSTIYSRIEATSFKCVLLVYQI